MLKGFAENIKQEGVQETHYFQKEFSSQSSSGENKKITIRISDYADSQNSKEEEKPVKVYLPT